MKVYNCKSEKTIRFMGDKIKVKQYLDYNEKNLFIHLIVQGMTDENNIFNPTPLSQDLGFVYGILHFYTDLEVENDNLVDLYNNVKGSGLFEKIVSNIPETELYSMQDMIDKSIIIEKDKHGITGAISGFINLIAEKIPDADVLQNSINKFSEDLKHNQSMIGISSKTKLRDIIKK